LLREVAPQYQLMVQHYAIAKGRLVSVVGFEKGGAAGNQEKRGRELGPKEKGQTSATGSALGSGSV
jgi:hypothetical protein